MMYATTIIAAAAATLLSGAGAPATAATKGAFDQMRMRYRAETNDYCIRSGWGLATRHTRRLVRAGDCRTAADWRARGLEFPTRVARPAPRG